MAPITLSETELRALLMDPSVPDARIAPYLMAVDGRAGHAPEAAPNPTLVTPGDEGGAVLISGLGRIARWRRKIAYRRKLQDWTGPKLVAAGDGWADFPLLERDLSDHLDARYAVRALGGTADLLTVAARQDELIAAIASERPDAVLLSAGAADLFGEGRLARFLRPHDPALAAPDYLTPEFDGALRALLDNWRELALRVAGAFPGLPLFCHGYDHFQPAGGEWLGRPLARLGITDPELQADVVSIIIDRLHAGLYALAEDPRLDGVLNVVDCRHVAGGDWRDELHPNSAGFGRMAQLFHEAIAARSGAAEAALWLECSAERRETQAHAADGMPPVYAEAAGAVLQMMGAFDEVALTGEIGRRAAIAAADPGRQPGLQATGADMLLELPVKHGTMDPHVAQGWRILRRQERELRTLLHGDDPDDAAERAALLKALETSREAGAAALTRILVAGFGLGLPIAVCAAALMLRRAANPEREEDCDVWGRAFLSHGGGPLARSEAERRWTDHEKPAPEEGVTDFPRPARGFVPGRGAGSKDRV